MSDQLSEQMSDQLSKQLNDKLGGLIEKFILPHIFSPTGPP